MSLTRNPAGDQFAVVSQSGPTISFFDARTHERKAVVDVPAEPHELLFDPQTRLVYCSHAYRGGFYDANEGRHTIITVLDADTHELVDTIDTSPEHGPHGLALDPVRRLLHVSVESGPAGEGGVIVLDADTREILHRISVEAAGPHWYLIDHEGTRGYSTNKEADFVGVLDLEKNALVRKIPMPGSEGLALSPDGATLAVCAPKANLGRLAADPGVRLIDTARGRVVRTLPTDDAVVPVAWASDDVLVVGQVTTPSPDNRDAHGIIDPFRSEDAPGGRLLIYVGDSAATLEQVAHVDIGVFPLTMTTSPDGSYVYVSAIASSTLSVVDIADPSAPAVVDEIHIDRRLEPGAHGLAYIPARS
ncbi:DNA-binding beta-propeller fold protein YncE [Streptomyces sp. B3I7]|uniref:YncE family protein n=1 Tax=Streptomyces sp. B3I7 TaxID=3042269 RepID=UPI00277D663D|nr:YncE family protein [Streptomyces sp. B3I7]MDQ0812258.1 DNA-binding beta-propeller fold protein YncE [Streptomyces sp. B3I7]